jgi:hypothetical protein
MRPKLVVALAKQPHLGRPAVATWTAAWSGHVASCHAEDSSVWLRGLLAAAYGWGDEDGLSMVY